MGVVCKRQEPNKTRGLAIMHWESISNAHKYWLLNRRLPDPPSNLEEAELFILNQKPVTVQDAACILDVICAYNGDWRCDGLDQTALARVHIFLSSAA